MPLRGEVHESSAAAERSGETNGTDLWGLHKGGTDGVAAVEEQREDTCGKATRGDCIRHDAASEFACSGMGGVRL